MKPLRAVVIDDDLSWRIRIKSILLRLFPDSIQVVDEAERVRDAVAVIQKHNPDIVFLDIELLGGTGFDVLDALEYNPDLHFQTIMVSTVAMLYVAEAKLRGVSAIIDKLDLEKRLPIAVNNIFKKLSSPEPLPLP